MRSNDFDEDRKIQFDGTDIGCSIVSAIAVLFLVIQLIRGIASF